MNKPTIVTLLKFAVFVVLLFLVRPYFINIILVSSAVLFFLPPKWKFPALSLINLVHIVFFNTLFLDTSYSYNRLLRNLQNIIPFGEEVRPFFIKIIATLLVSGLVTLLHSKMKISCAFVTFLKLFTVLVLLIIAMLFMSEFPFLQLLLWASLTIFSKYFFIVLYSLWKRKSAVFLKQSKIGVLLHFPFWSGLSNYHIHNIPRGYQELEEGVFKKQKESVDAALQSLLISLILAVVTTVIWDLIFGTQFFYRISWMPSLPSFHFPSIYKIGLRNFNQLHMRLPVIWLVSLTYGICFIFKNASQIFAIVSIVQICGFSVPPPVRNISKSNSFSDFLGRYYFYYGDYIKNFFYYPILMRIDKFAMSSGFKKVISSFLAIFVGGISAHFIIEVSREAEMRSITKVLMDTLIFAPYLFALGMFASISIFSLHKKRTWFNKLFIVFIFLLTYSLCYSLQMFFASKTYGFEVDAGDFIQYLKSLFGLS